MKTKNRITRTSTDVQLTPISNTEWRVSDSRVPWDSAFSLIGFISMNAGAYEVLEFGDPMRTFFVGSMAKAESKFVRQAGRLDERLERLLPLCARGQLSH